MPQEDSSEGKMTKGFAFVEYQTAHVSGAAQGAGQLQSCTLFCVQI